MSDSVKLSEAEEPDEYLGRFRNLVSGTTLVAKLDLWISFWGQCQNALDYTDNSRRPIIRLVVCLYLESGDRTHSFGK